MIQPDKLRQYNVAEIPPSVFLAWESHRAFVSASSFAAESIGIRFLDGVKPATLALGFFRTMLENEGTKKDVKWLLNAQVIEWADVRSWVAAVKEYSARALA
jgi:hypothetical protein